MRAELPATMSSRSSSMYVMMTPISSMWPASMMVGPPAPATLITALDRATIERYRDTRLRGGSTTRTVRKDLTILALAWRWGREVGHVEAGRDAGFTDYVAKFQRETLVASLRDCLAEPIAA